MRKNHEKLDLILEGKHGRKFLADITLQKSKNSGRVIIFSHGFKGFKDWGPFDEIADYFAERGFIFLKFNFAFNGTTLDQPTDFNDLEAFGQNNFTKELDDLDVVIDWITSQSDIIKADVNHISLIGHSRGGGVSILKGFEDDRIRSVVTWASVAEFSRHISKSDIIKWKENEVLFVENSRTGQQMPLYIQLYHDYIKNHRRFNIRNAVRNFPKPLLLAHGTEDDTVPFSHAVELSLLNTTNARLQIISGGGHTFGSAHPTQVPGLTDHFLEVLRHTDEFLKSL